MNALASAVRAMDSSALRVTGGIFSGLALRHVLLAVVFTVGYNVFGQLGWLGYGEWSVIIRLKSFAQMPLHLAVACFAILAAVAVDNKLQSGTARWMRYPVAALIAAVAGGALIEVYAPPIVEPDAKVQAVLAQFPDVLLFLVVKRFLTALYISTLVVALYVVLETNHAASLALHAARLRSLVEQRDVCAAELSAMQARVDPELLFESLRLVDEAYGTDAEVGQAKMDALIRFLRAALPGKSGVNSTVRLEKELVEAYVALVAPDRALPHQTFFQTSPDLLDERLPPMILLPMLRWALAVGACADGLTMSVGRRGGAAAAAETLVLTVANRSPGASSTSDDEIQVIRGRLECLFGDAVHVRLSADANQRVAVVEFPVDGDKDRGCSGA